MPPKNLHKARQAELAAALKEFKASFAQYQKAMKEFKQAVEEAGSKKRVTQLRKKLRA